MRQMLLVINHGQGNIGSLCNTLEFLGKKYEVCEEYNPNNKYLNYKGFILPGVGAFNAGMKSLRARSLDVLVRHLNNNNVPGMGICLGMQMLCCSSEEGGHKESGLSIIKGKVKKLNVSNGMVPSIGWRETVSEKKAGTPLQDGAYYYVHSYHVETDDPSTTCAHYKHGDAIITAAIKKDNLLGVQFHPEKSQSSGLDLIANFFED